MEPPFWYYPVRQSLGAARLMAGDAEGAEEAFRASLVKAPNNGWALYGLMQAQTRRGAAEAARETSRSLEQAWAGDRNVLNLDRL